MNQLIITFLFSFLPTESLPRMLESPDPEIRAAAAAEIGDRWPETKNLLPALAKTLNDHDSRVREAAANALASIRYDAKTAVADLFRAALHATDARTRAACLGAATGIVRWVPQNGGMWSRPRHIPVQPPLLKAARCALNDKASVVRLQAIELLDVMAEKCPEAVAALSEALRDPDSSVRQRAAKALLEAGPAGRTTIAALRRVLSDPCITVRAQAALALWQMREPAKALVPALIDLLQPRARKDRGRTRIDWAVAEITDAAIYVLGFEDADGAEQERLVNDALSSLQDMGAPVERFEPTLKALLQDDSPSVRLGAAGVLLRANCDRDAAIRTLICLVRDGPGDMRLKASSCLMSLRADAASFVPVFVSMLRDEDESNRWSQTFTSLQCLASIGERATAALPRLDELIRHGSPIIRVEAAKTRWAIDPKPEPVVPALASGIADPLTRLTALQVLEEIGPAAKAALPALKRVVTTPRAI